MRLDALTNTVVEAQLWFVTALAADMLLERQSHVLTVFTLDPPEAGECGGVG